MSCGAPKYRGGGGRAFHPESESHTKPVQLSLIAYRSSLSIAQNSSQSGAADVTHYSFIPDSTPTAALANAKHYAAFLTRSGLSKVLEGIKSVGDYAMGR